VQARRIGVAAALELHQIFRDRPALADLADDIRLRNLHVGEEDLVLDVFARQHHQRLDLHARRLHVDQQEGDAALGNVLLRGADEIEDAVRVIRVGRPDLRAVAEEVIALVDGAHLEAREIGARARFRIALAPEVGAVEDARQVERLLLRRAVADQDRAAHAEAHRRESGRAGCGQLAREDIVLHHRPVAAAIFLRPGRRHPALFVKGAVPGHGRLVIGIDAGHQLADRAELRRQLLVEKAADLVAEGRIACAQRKIHLQFPPNSQISIRGG